MRLSDLAEMLCIALLFAAVGLSVAGILHVASMYDQVRALR